MWQVIKKSVLDLWDEMLYMILFNLIWLAGTLLILPGPFVTFALFYTVKDVGEGYGIKLSTFFQHGRRLLKPAYIWGLINLSIFISVTFGIRFYGALEVVWAGFIQLFLVSLIFFWGVLQLIALALYPRQVTPSFRLALRNAAVITGRHPLAIFGLLVGVFLLLALSAIIQPAALVITFSAITMLTNNVVNRLVTQALKQQQSGQ